jgi:hypothetical protein
MWTKFKRWKKFKEDEIKNNFQIEIIYTNKKIVTKKYGLNLKEKQTEGLLWSFLEATHNSRRERERRKKSINAKLSSITIHAPLKEVGTAETNKKITKEGLFGHLKSPLCHLNIVGRLTRWSLSYFFLLFFILIIISNYL